MKTVNLRGSFGNVSRKKVIFESKLIDSDDVRFVVAETNTFGVSVEQKVLSTGILIAAVDRHALDPLSGNHSPALVFNATDDKHFIASQLRDLADWFESQGSQLK